jgi:hypothetical protein
MRKNKLKNANIIFIYNLEKLQKLKNAQNYNNFIKIFLKRKTIRVIRFCIN